MIAVLAGLFDTGDFMSHGHCYRRMGLDRRGTMNTLSPPTSEH